MSSRMELVGVVHFCAAAAVGKLCNIVIICPLGSQWIRILTFTDAWNLGLIRLKKTVLGIFW